MSDERRIELVNKLFDHGVDDSEYAELDRLQRSARARIEPPIDIKNEIRMAMLDDMAVANVWSWNGYALTQDDIASLARGDHPTTIGPKGVARPGILGGSQVKPFSAVGESSKEESKGDLE